MKRLALIGLALLTAGALVFAGGMAKTDWKEDGKELLAQAGTNTYYSGWSRVDHFEEMRHDFKGPIQKVQAELKFGSLEIKTAGPDERPGILYSEAYDKHEKLLYQLKIEENQGLLTIRDDFKAAFNNVGFDFSFDNPLRTVLILPAESQLDDLTITLDAGDLNFQGVKALKSNFKLSAGQMSLEDADLQKSIIDLDMGSLKVNGGVLSESELTIDMGELEAKKVDFKDNQVKVSMGSVDMDGTLTGRNAIEADMGSVDIDTSLPRSEYDMDVTGDMSNIEVEGGAQGGNRESGNVIQVQVDMGDVKINFGR